MMSLAGQKRILFDFFQTVAGLVQTGKQGRIDTRLQAPTEHIFEYLAVISAKTLHQALAVIQRTVTAKERDDKLTLTGHLQQSSPRRLHTGCAIL